MGHKNLSCFLWDKYFCDINGGKKILILTGHPECKRSVGKLKVNYLTGLIEKIAEKMPQR